jgi:hypothetical protein
MAYKYSIWSSGPIGDNCVLGGLQGYEDSWELTEGEALAKSWKNNVRFSMDPDYPRNTVLTDCLINVNNLIVGSERLKKLLEVERVSGVEFLPVQILDHKGKKISASYWIVSPVAPVDCIDKQKSRLKWSKIDKTRISNISKLVIDESLIPAQRPLFRVAGSAALILVSNDLAKKIDAAGLTNIVWEPIAKFKG